MNQQPSSHGAPGKHARRVVQVINNFDLPSCPFGAQLSGLSYNFAAGLTYWVLMAGNGIAPITDARLLVTAAALPSA